MSEDAQKEHRTEQPSEQRLRDAREKGQVPRSRGLGNVAVLGCAVLALKATGGDVGAASRDWLRNALSFDRALLESPDRLLPHAGGLLLDLIVPLLPLMLTALVACAIAPAAMGGLRFAGKVLAPDFNRLNPLKGIARLYSSEILAELLRSMLRVALIGGIGGWVVW